ncbi:DUF1145 domain-containing protein [Marinagarivorans algicola]|uniref:DUF1145 domain-containing protein n=1 Tax=Marinagarivorans algicola TaxID=1513270 RepID=UPI0006B8AEE5|nr:DUF1145 domain-containing protein [Marinagarivorans algicola]
MSSQVTSIIQWVTLMFWLGVAINVLIVLTVGGRQVLIVLGVLLCMIHSIEYVFVRLIMRKPISFFKTMIYGCGHWLPMVKK